jgi:hypothetical protein
VGIFVDRDATQGASVFSNMRLSAVCRPVIRTARDDVHITAGQ